MEDFMSFEEWLKFIKHMKIEDYNNLSFHRKLYIENEYYNEGY